MLWVAPPIGCSEATRPKFLAAISMPHSGALCRPKGYAVFAIIQAGLARSVHGLAALRVRNDWHKTAQKGANPVQ